jgi:phosphatidylglycerol:prolipoprotein diacylglycerol transferase
LLALAAAGVGARLQYVLAHWQEYAARPVNALNVWEGGLALPGAVTAGALASWPALRRARLPLGACLDAAAPGLALGQAIGRLGCLAAGCAFGAPVEANTLLPHVLLPDATGALAARFPSQLLEAGGELALALVLLVIWRRHPVPGTVACFYLIGYGLLRGLAEPFRGDSTYWLALPVARWWALAAALAGALLLLRLHRSAIRMPVKPQGATHAPG